MLGREPGDGDDEGEEEQEVDGHPTEDPVGDGQDLDGGVQQKVGEYRGQCVDHAYKNQTSPSPQNRNNDQSAWIDLRFD